VALDTDTSETDERSEPGEGSYRIGKVVVHLLRCAVRLGRRPPPHWFSVVSDS